MKPDTRELVRSYTARRYDSACSIRVMISILGAGGAIGTELVKELNERGRSLRLMSRNGAGEGALRADLNSAADMQRAVEGAEIAVLLVGLKYDLAVWRKVWP